MDQELVRTIRSTLCRRLSTDEAAGLVAAMVPRKVPAGGAICREGDETSGAHDPVPRLGGRVEAGP